MWCVYQYATVPVSKLLHERAALLCMLELECDGLSESAVWSSHTYNSSPGTDGMIHI